MVEVVILDPIRSDTASAFDAAWRHSRKSSKQFARAVSGLVRLPPLTEEDVILMANGDVRILGDYLVAAGRVAEQPLSVFLGETPLYDKTIPDLERQLDEILSTLKRRTKTA